MLMENYGKIALQSIWMVIAVLISGTILLDVRYQGVNFTFTDVVIAPTTALEAEIDIDEEGKRLVASDYYLAKPGVQYFPVNSLNRKFIAGFWLITRYIDHLSRPMDINKKVQLKLIATSRIEIGNDPNERFSISVINADGSMALMRPLKGGYEILEMQKIFSTLEVKKAKSASPSALSSFKDDINEAGAVSEEVSHSESVVELELEKGFSSSGDFPQQHVEGTMKRYDNLLDIDVRLKNTDGSSIEVRLDACEVNGTSFIATLNGETFIGLINENGSATSFSVRFPIGPFQGISLNFASQQEIEQRQVSSGENAEEVETPAPSETVPEVQASIPSSSTGVNKSSINIDENQASEIEENPSLDANAEEAAAAAAETEVVEKSETLEREGFQF